MKAEENTYEDYIAHIRILREELYTLYEATKSSPGLVMVAAPELRKIERGTERLKEVLDMYFGKDGRIL